MARSTFKVLFYVNGSKEKNGIVPIMGRVTINGTVAQFSFIVLQPKRNEYGKKHIQGAVLRERQ